MYLFLIMFKLNRSWFGSRKKINYWLNKVIIRDLNPYIIFHKFNVLDMMIPPNIAI